MNRASIWSPENIQMRSRGGPRPKKTYSATLERSSKYHVISIAKKHFYRNIWIRPYLSISPVNRASSATSHSFDTTKIIKFMSRHTTELQAGFLKSKSGVVVPRQPGSQILLATKNTGCPSPTDLWWTAAGLLSDYWMNCYGWKFLTFWSDPDLKFHDAVFKLLFETLSWSVQIFMMFIDIFSWYSLLYLHDVRWMFLSN
jgi:hypothetical protein